MTPAAHWKQVFSGIAFDVFEPTLESIRIEDIAHALACTNRYGGHAPEPFSVAQHSVLVSDVAGTLGGDDEFARWGLLHDAAEAYLGDTVRPVKQHPSMQFLRDAEDGLSAMIHLRFGLSYPAPAVVKYADECLLATEAARFFPEARRPFPWNLSGMVLPQLDVTPWHWWKAETEFFARFAALWPNERTAAA